MGSQAAYYSPETGKSSRARGEGRCRFSLTDQLHVGEDARPPSFMLPLLKCHCFSSLRRLPLVVLFPFGRLFRRPRHPIIDILW
jgi:hypothetical protein